MRPHPSRLLRPFPLTLLLSGGLLTAAPTAEARRNGVAFTGCEGCHGASDPAPTFSVSTDPEVFNPGDTVTLTLSIHDPSMRTAGFYMTKEEGEFQTIAGENAKLIEGNLAHDTPVDANGGVAQVRVRWTAPGEPGGTDFQVYGLATNDDNNRNGDRPGDGTVSVVYGCTGTRFYRDLDRDGIGSSDYGISLDCSQQEGWASVDGDCNENNPEIFPGQVEICNERDDDCNGEVDEGTTPRELFPDDDGDGYGVNRDVILGCVPPRGYADNADDCNDDNPMIHPGAEEICNGFDDNCNRREDEGVRARCGVGLCERYAVSCFSDECFPGEPFPETCNGLDDDCDGVVDNDAPCPEGQECYIYQCIDSDEAEVLREMEEENEVPDEPGVSPEPGTPGETTPQPSDPGTSSPAPSDDPDAEPSPGVTTDEPTLSTDSSASSGGGCAVVKGQTDSGSGQEWIWLSLAAAWLSARRLPAGGRRRRQ